jgi:8-oxo-dGTP pyrophosphatase MutT (NUDIX family)
MKPTDVGVGVAVILTDRKNHPDAVLMGLRKGAHRPGLLALPGGWLDRGDTTIQAAGIREVMEEVGLRVEPMAFKARFYPTTEDHADFRTVTIYMTANVDCPDGVISGRETEKCIQWNWIPRANLALRHQERPASIFPNTFRAVSELLGW